MIRLKNLLKESNRVKRLFEQVKSLATVTFTKTFANNYITPNENWKKQADLIVAEIKKAQDLGYKLVDIEIAINGGASPVPASNVYSGPTPPKHDFGGLLKKYNAKWVKPGESGGTNIEPDIGTKKGGTEGNKWLALNRALKLKDLLIPYLQKYFGKVPIDLIKATGQDGTTKFVHATITPKVEKRPGVKNKPINYTIGTIGGGYSGTRIYTEQYPKGKILTFNRTLLSIADEKKQRTGTDVNQTFQGADFGRGPGVGVYISKEIALKMYQAQPIGTYFSLTGLKNYGGDPAEFEQAIWNMITYLNTPEGKNNKRYRDIPLNYKNPIKLDYNPKTEKAWQYINPANGQIKAGVQPIVFTGTEYD